MRSTYNIISGIFLLGVIILISFSCAQEGGGTLVGGAKDVAPPVVLSSTPENFSTNFTGQDFEFIFDEYFALKELNNKLVVSPPMEEKPEIKVKGKKLQIHFPNELLPDRTYTLNFGDALADLNENNAYENFAVVFSTGNEIDSLEIQGSVIDAFTGEPVEGVSVMLYASKAEGQEGKKAEGSGVRQIVTEEDSLPLTNIPLYVSRTNKEGKYHLKNLAGGNYKIFALLDGNNNYLFDQATEQVAFIDSLVEGRPAAKTPRQVGISASLQKDEAIVDSTAIELIKKDSTLPHPQTLSHELASEGEGSGVRQADSTQLQQFTDSTDVSPMALELTQDSIRGDKPTAPLRLFLESLPRQQIRGTERKQADKVLLIFNEPLDSVNMELLHADGVEDGVVYEWSEMKDSLICWMTDSLLSMRDSLVFATGYLGYDSLEQREWIVDTLRFKFRPVPPKPEDRNPMIIKSNTGRTMELGVPFSLSSELPFESIDTSKISLFRVRDSLEFKEELKIIEVETQDNLPGINQGKSSRRKVIVDKVFMQDSSYSLRVLPGAFSSWLGHTNDSLTVDFIVNNIEKYGAIIMKIENLDEPAVLQLLNSKDKPIDERIISGNSEEKFELLKPAKYKFKLILDKNGNGKWDTGRYLKKIQPEEILVYAKEITLKANWEMEETWEVGKKGL